MAKGFNELMSADWINDRFINVLDGVTQLIDRMVASIYADGYGPLETSVTKPDIEKLSTEEFQEMLESQPTLGGQAELLREAERLRIPKEG
jgi:hypothetical protein